MAIDSRLRENDVSYMFRSHPREGGNSGTRSCDSRMGLSPGGRRIQSATMQMFFKLENNLALMGSSPS